MRPIALSLTLGALAACADPGAPDRGTGTKLSPQFAKATSTNGVSISRLPTLDGRGAAYAVNGAGTTIVGVSGGRPVKWTLSGASWVLAELPGGAGSEPYAVNASGIAVGVSVVAGVRRAVMWSAEGTLTVLGCATDAGPDAAWGVNAHGTAVGSSSAASQSGAVIWRAGGCRQTLRGPDGGAGVLARAINDADVIVGDGRDAAGKPVAVRWRVDNGGWVPEVLGLLSAWAVNAAGGAAGASCPANTAYPCNQHAFLWPADGSAGVDLGTLGGWADVSFAFGINANGDVVGRSLAPGAKTGGFGDTHAFLWRAGVMRDIGTLRGDTDSEARGIASVNAADNGTLVVGKSSNQRQESHPVVWMVR